MTEETPFEKKWRPIRLPKNRLPAKKRDPEAVYNWSYDRRPIDKGLFQDFEDQGEKLREYENPAEAAKDLEYWEEEE